MPKPIDIRRAALVAALFLAALSAGAQPARAQEGGAERVPALEVSARAWAVTDLKTGEYLAGSGALEELPMASTTKVMGALVALDTDLDGPVTVSEEAAAFAVPAYSNVGLLPGDVLSARELLMASMISSGDDAAYALAEHVGGGSVERFVGMMNERAEEMGLQETSFENPVGFDARDHHTSARDLATMTREAMHNPEFREMVSTEYATIATPYREIPLTNTNELLFAYPPATGVKTGTTPAAGESMVSSASRGDETYAFVILDAGEDRFAASIRALEHAFAAYDRADLIVRGEKYAGADVPYRREESIDLVAARDVEGLVDASLEVEREITVVEEPPPSARPGTRLGEVVVKVDGRVVGASPLVTRRGYEEASLWERVWYTVGGVIE
ncbi:MAG: D-alanyl-D-alanine carboxypeptidase [uncultured Rubrobacteraceae bacterium]|uniref:serine-type D-Ala-D-Ala carboxypeptidase n=1 Tax=uncultured Rubrobacteraceae bacterium TaxID=349277 RepID=A0A6J4RPL0_9ACTN|nr:MAG: D-alanyl-D-alanine carboxypeptidase [uncultured Rubrobacteraceae bacterium]